MSIDNVIGSYGVTNLASFNVLAINDDKLVGGINATTFEESFIYEIRWGLFDDEEREVEPAQDGEYEYNTTRSYIMNDGIRIFIDEIERIKFVDRQCENVFDGFCCNENYTESCEDADCDSLYCHTCNACNTCK